MTLLHNWVESLCFAMETLAFSHSWRAGLRQPCGGDRRLRCGSVYPEVVMSPSTCSSGTPCLGGMISRVALDWADRHHARARLNSPPQDWCVATVNSKRYVLKRAGKEAHTVTSV